MRAKSNSTGITFAALIVLALGIFTSISFSSLAHVLLLISGSHALACYLKRRDLPIPPRVWALLALWISCLLSVFFNWQEMENPINNMLKTKYFLIGILSYFAFRNAASFLTEKKIKFLISLFLIATSLASASGLIALATGFNPLKMQPACHPTRACGMNGMIMTYAYGINFFLVALVGALIHRNELKGYLPVRLATLALAINGIGLFFSYTRGAWIGFLTAIPFFFFKQNKKIFLLAMLAGMLLLGGGLLTSPKVRDTFFKRSGSNSQRIAFFRSALAAFGEKPWFGYGYHNFESNVLAIKARHSIPWPDHAGHAHNNFLEHLAATGAPGAIAFILFCLSWIIDCWRRRDVLGKIIFPVTVSFVVSGAVQYTFGDGENLFLLMLLWAL